MPRIVDVALVDRAIDPKDPALAPVLRQLYPRTDDPFPLCEQLLTFRIEGVDSVVANSFQRVMTQELVGTYMTAEVSAMEGSTDPFMKPEFVIYNRVTPLPLVHGLNASTTDGLVLGVDVTNNTTALMTVYSGDIAVVAGKLARPIFNPTHEIAVLQPGKRLVISQITFLDSLGRTAAPAATAICGTSIPEMPRMPREETHFGLQGNAQRSGFVEPSTTARPRNFKVSAVIPAAYRGSTNALKLPARACDNILMRLRQALEVINTASRATDEVAPARAGVASDISSWVLSEADGLATGVLSLRGETFTVAEIVRSELNNQARDLSYAGVENGADSTSISIKATRAGDAADLLALFEAAIKNLMAVYTVLQQSL